MVFDIYILISGSLFQNYFQQWNKIPAVFSLGKIGKDPTVLRMYGNLRNQRIPQYLKMKIISNISLCIN